MASSRIVAPAPDLLAVVASASATPRFYLHDPASRSTIAALGAADVIDATGPERLVAGAEAVADRLSAIEAVGNVSPLAVGGFAFADDGADQGPWRELPPFRFFVPRLVWIRRDDECRLVRVDPPDGEEETDHWVRESLTTTPIAEPAYGLTPTSDPEGPIQWRRRIEAVASLIREGILTKIVLSRVGTLAGPETVPVARIVAGLCAARPTCRTFWFANRETSFFGSSPEQLVAREGQRVTSMALAGTSPRGSSAALDSRLARELSASTKNRHEHALVVDALRDALVPITRRLRIGEEPSLLSIPEAHHLRTGVEGELREPWSVLDLAALLHPTPAVCGVPRDLAAAILAREEPHRGWYTGGIGWMDATGDGDVTVALRSALADGNELHLFAGAGIVAGSDADAELAETEAKLAALRHQLERLRGRHAA